MTGNIPVICVYSLSGLVQSEVVQPRVIRECGPTSSKRLAILTYKMRVLSRHFFFFLPVQFTKIYVRFIVIGTFLELMISMQYCTDPIQVQYYIKTN